MRYNDHENTHTESIAEPRDTQAAGRLQRDLPSSRPTNFYITENGLEEKSHRLRHSKRRQATQMQMSGLVVFKHLQEHIRFTFPWAGRTWRALDSDLERGPEPFNGGSAVSERPRPATTKTTS